MNWPQKTRDIFNHHMDSTHWDGFKFRDDDIIVGTWGKAGTTWTQQIVAQLLFNGDTNVNIDNISPWLDIRVMPKEVKFDILEQQQHRRCIKTHLPVDALVFSPQAKYLYVARDMPDIVWSMYNHMHYALDDFYDMINNTPGLVGPKLERPAGDVYQYFNDFLEKDGYPCWAFWENIRTWWEIRELPNVKLLHFNDLKQDLEGEMRGIAAFLDIPIDEAAWPAIVEHCTFKWMKDNADMVAPQGGAMWENGGQTFINKGENKRWKDVLSEGDIARYQAKAVQELGDECAQWLFAGKS